MSNVSPESEIFLKSPHFSIRSQDIFSFTAPQSREGAGYNPFRDLSFFVVSRVRLMECLLPDARVRIHCKLFHT